MDRVTPDFSKDLYKFMSRDLYERIKRIKGGDTMPCGGKKGKKKGGRKGK